MKLSDLFEKIYNKAESISPQHTEEGVLLLTRNIDEWEVKFISASCDVNETKEYEWYVTCGIGTSLLEALKDFDAEIDSHIDYLGSVEHKQSCDGKVVEIEGKKYRLVAED